RAVLHVSRRRRPLPARAANRLLQLLHGRPARLPRGSGELRAGAREAIVLPTPKPNGVRPQTLASLASLDPRPVDARRRVSSVLCRGCCPTTSTIVQV